MPRKGKSKPTGRKSGAQPGNKNAMRHGFYAQRFTIDDNKLLDSQDTLDVTSEIAMLRVQINKLLEEIDYKIVLHHDESGNTTRDGHYLQQLNTLAIINQSLSTHVRTIYLGKSKGGDIAQTIWEAIMSLNPYKEL